MKEKGVPLKVAPSPEDLFRPVPYDHELSLEQIEGSEEYKKWLGDKIPPKVSKQKLVLLARMDERRQRVGPVGVRVTELIKEGRRR